MSQKYQQLVGHQHKWFISVLPNGQNEDFKEDFKSTSSNSSVFIGFEDFGGKVRFTPDGRVSVYMRSPFRPDIKILIKSGKTS